MFGLGKNRSAFGKYLDRHGIKQDEVVAKSGGLSRNAVSRLCDGEQDHEKLQVRTKSMAISALRKMGYDVRPDDFWT